MKYLSQFRFYGTFHLFCKDEPVTKLLYSISMQKERHKNHKFILFVYSHLAKIVVLSKNGYTWKEFVLCFHVTKLHIYEVPQRDYLSSF